MISRMHLIWTSLAKRQRTGIIALIGVALTGLYLALLLTAGPARDRLQVNVMALRKQSAQLSLQAAEYARLRNAPVPGIAKTDLRSVVQSQADAAGLSGALVKIEVQDADRVQITFGSIAFGDWLDWIRSLHAQHTRIESCRIEALTAAGLVSVTAVLVRTRPQ